MKNIDRIKQMTADELAGFFYDFDRCSEIDCSECAVRKFLPKLCARTTLDGYKRYFASEVDNG